MATTFNFIPYNKASASVKVLRQAINGVTLSSQSPRLERLFNGDRATNNHVFIKWGKTAHDTQLNSLDNRDGVLLLNNKDLSNYTNKRKFFEMLSGTGVVPYLPQVFNTRNDALLFWNSRAREAAENEIILVERQSLTDSGGNGIKFLTRRVGPTDRGMLWTSYIKKKHEYRVHASKTGIIAIQKKFLPLGVASSDEHTRQTQFSLRNYNNGWRYQLSSLEDTPQCVLEAVNRFINSGKNIADFCALDIIYNEASRTAFILEANTAPGVSSPLTDKYVEYFREKANEYFGGNG